MDSLRELERSTGTSTSMSGTGEAQVSHNKLSYGARKELSKVIKKAEKAVAEAEARISELENGIAVIEAKLATPEGASDASLYGEYSALKRTFRCDGSMDRTDNGVGRVEYAGFMKRLLASERQLI